MALMLGKLYAALLAGGADEQKAREAAEEVAGFESRIAKVAKVESDLILIKWMLGLNLAATMAILVRVFSHG